jgi:hypothetical protein
MSNSSRLLLVGCLAGLGALVSEGSAHAQFNPYAAYYQSQLQQQMWNAQAAQANLARQVLPLQQAIADPYTGLANPYAANSPYTPNVVDPGVGAGYNPYNPYNPYYNPWSSFGPGATLMGQADVMRAYGKVVNDQEEARIKRELANQARLDTVKKEFDLRMYIKANTPTYTQEQERIAKNTLRRIQSNSLPGEIASGKSLNYLLKDLAGKKLEGEPLPLSEAVLNQLNVTKGTFGVGILRDDGRVTFPTALSQQMSNKQRDWLNMQLQELVKEAAKGRPVDANVLRDVRSEVDLIREELVKKVNEIPTSQYLDAKRFLQDFNDATIALERGEAVVQSKFQRDMQGGKTLQELADYMAKNGLRFAPATAADEAAYRAVHSVLANYNITMNSQNLGVSAKD